MLDTETDVRMRSDIQYTLTSMLQTLAPANLTHWLGLCRDVLSAAKANKGLPKDKKPDSRSKGEKDIQSLIDVPTASHHAVRPWFISWARCRI